MNSFAALFISLVLGTGFGSTPQALSAASGAIDASSQDCQDAQKLAASGVFHGSQVSSGNSLDKCIAAVFDPSRVSPVDSNPRANPNNFRCVGKSVRITSSFSSGTAVIESWSASESVPVGKCSVLYCTGSHCSSAKLVDGGSWSSTSDGSSEYTIEANPLNEPPTKQSEFNAALDKLDAEKNPSLSKRVDDAFTGISATQYQKDSNGVPDVTKPAYPDLQKQMDVLDYSNSQSEKGAPQTGNKPEDYAIVNTNSSMYTLAPSPQEFSGVDTVKNQSPAPDLPVTSQQDELSTFPGQGHAGTDAPIADTSGKQSWGASIVSHTEAGISSMTAWAEGTASSIKNSITGFFGR